MAYTTSAQKVHVQPVHVEAPFPMDSVYLCTFPNKEFPITKYGARKGNNHLNTQAFAKAIEACHRAGGGRVVVPAGEWFTRTYSSQKPCQSFSGRRSCGQVLRQSQ